MVARSYVGLGTPESAVAKFDRLAPYVVELLALRSECDPRGPDYKALGIALDGLQTAAFHFTRRRHFYCELEAERPAYQAGNDRLQDRSAAITAFEALTPYAHALSAMQQQCRPFGRDYLALGIALDSLGSAAFHFTREATFYGAKSDSAGAVRPAR